eukprot:EG_transcript_753
MAVSNNLNFRQQLRAGRLSVVTEDLDGDSELSGSSHSRTSESYGEVECTAHSHQGQGNGPVHHNPQPRQGGKSSSLQDRRCFTPAAKANHRPAEQQAHQQKKPHVAFADGPANVSDLEDAEAQKHRLTLSPSILHRSGSPAKESDGSNRDEFLRAMDDYQFPNKASPRSVSVDAEQASSTPCSQASLSFHTSPSGSRRGQPRGPFTPNTPKSVTFRIDPLQQMDSDLTDRTEQVESVARGITEDDEPEPKSEDLGGPQETAEVIRVRSFIKATEHAMPTLPAAADSSSSSTTSRQNSVSSHRQSLDAPPPPIDLLRPPSFLRPHDPGRRPSLQRRRRSSDMPRQSLSPYHKNSSFLRSPSWDFQDVCSVGTDDSGDIGGRQRSAIVVDEEPQDPRPVVGWDAREGRAPIRWANGVAMHTDGSLEAPDGTRLLPNGQVHFVDGRRDVVSANGSVLLANGGALLPNGWLKRPDGVIIMTDGGLLLPNGSVDDSGRQPSAVNVTLPAQPLFEPCVCCAGTGCEAISGLVPPNTHSASFFLVTTLGLVVGFSFEWAWDYLYSVVPSNQQLTVAVLYPILGTVCALGLYYVLTTFLVRWKPCAQSAAATFLDAALGMGLSGVALANTVFKICDLVTGSIGVVLWVLAGLFCPVATFGLYYLQGHRPPTSVLSISAAMLCSATAYVTGQFPFGVLQYVFLEDPQQPNRQGYDWLVMAIVPAVVVTLVGLAAFMAFSLQYFSIIAAKDVMLVNLTWVLIAAGLMLGSCLKTILCPFTEQHDPTLPVGGEFAMCVYNQPGQGTGGGSPTATYFLYLIMAVIITVSFGLFVIWLLKFGRDQLLLYSAANQGHCDPDLQRKAILLVGYLTLGTTWAVAFFAATFVHWLQRATVMIFVRLIDGPALQVLAIFAWSIGLLGVSLWISNRIDWPHVRATKAHVVWRERWRKWWREAWMRHASVDVCEADLGELVSREMERVMLGVDLLAGPPLEPTPNNEAVSVEPLPSPPPPERARQRRSTAGSLGTRPASFWGSPNPLFRQDFRDANSPNYHVIMAAISSPRSYRTIPIPAPDPVPEEHPSSDAEPPLVRPAPLLRLDGLRRISADEVELQLPPFAPSGPLTPNMRQLRRLADAQDLEDGKTVVYDSAGSSPAAALGGPSVAGPPHGLTPRAGPLRRA